MSKVMESVSKVIKILFIDERPFSPEIQLKTASKETSWRDIREDFEILQKGGVLVTK